MYVCTHIYNCIYIYIHIGVDTESANGRANTEVNILKHQLSYQSVPCRLIITLTFENFWQGFYKQQWPLEGVPRRHQPSASTINGYLFDCYTSRIN